MVHDDDTPRTWGIDPDDEPSDPRAPRNAGIGELIAKTALDNPTWDRIRIYEELCDRNRNLELDQAEVDHVLERYKLRNRYL